MTTYLQMINRVRRRLSQPDVATLDADDITPPIGDMVNECAREILEGAEWNFLLKDDGYLRTVASATTTTGGTTPGTGGTGFTDFSGTITATDYAGDFVTRFRVTSNTSYGDTSFSLASTNTVGGFAIFNTNEAWPGSADTTQSFELFAAEYLLPDTVADVLSVRHQEQDMHLVWVPSFDSVTHRLHESFSDVPQTVYVGSRITSTYDADSASEGTTGLGMLIQPSPESVLALNYSYRLRHAEMTATTDTLAGVPEHIIDRIVELATSQAYLSFVGNDINFGAKLRADVMDRLEKDWKRHRADPVRRSVLSSHFARRSHGAVPSRPANRLVFYTE